jgi:hypothetical protein
VTGIILRDPVTEGYKAMLVAAGLKVEIGSAPATLNTDEQGKLIDPYSIIYPITGAELRGTLGQPERSGPLPYQVTSVGRTQRSAQIQADLVRIATATRVPGGPFLHPLDAGAGMVISDRRTREIGTPEAIEGLWQVADTYVLEVQAL